MLLIEVSRTVLRAQQKDSFQLFVKNWSFDARVQCMKVFLGKIWTKIGIAIDDFFSVQKASRNSNFEGRTLNFDGIFEIYAIFWPRWSFVGYPPSIFRLVNLLALGSTWCHSMYIICRHPLRPLITLPRPEVFQRLLCAHHGIYALKLHLCSSSAGVILHGSNASYSVSWVYRYSAVTVCLSSTT